MTVPTHIKFDKDSGTPVSETLSQPP